jgi:hypothetical protein
VARIELSASEIIDALRAATGNGELGPADAFTRNEIQAAIGWGLPRISAHLLALKSRGLVEIVTVKRERLDGLIASVPGYRFLKAKKKAGR